MKKFMGIANLVWAFEADVSDTESHQVARKQFYEALAQAGVPQEFLSQFKIHVKANKVAKFCHQSFPGRRSPGLYSPEVHGAGR